MFEPWQMPASLQAKLGQGIDIPQPMIELASATRTAKQRLHARRQNSEVRAGKKAVVEKHASRKTITRSKAVSRKADNTQQLGFDF
jgi:deoxyribodipyrimidine photo-lyase